MNLSRPHMHTLVALKVVTSDGWPASTREVAKQAGYQSVSTAHYNLCALRTKGYAISNPRRSGGWLPANARTTEF